MHLPKNISENTYPITAKTVGPSNENPSEAFIAEVPICSEAIANKSSNSAARRFNGIGRESVTDN